MNKINENTGGLINDNTEPLTIDRPDLQLSPTACDKSMEESIGDTTELGMDVDLEEGIEQYPFYTYQDSTITNQILVEAIRFKKTNKEKVKVCFDIISASLPYTLNDQTSKTLNTDCRKWLQKLQTMLKKVSRKYSRLRNDWLKKFFRISKQLPEKVRDVEEPSDAFHPQLTPRTPSRLTFNRKVKALSTSLGQISPKKLLKAVTVKTKESGMPLVSEVIKLTEKSPGRAKKILHAVRQQTIRERNPMTLLMKL